MKRTGYLFDDILDRDNLRLAFHKAMRGKRQRAEVQRFARQLDESLNRMAEQLSAGTCSLGKYSQFVIFDPKQRVITAPCFSERVLHHAIVNVCEPHFERWLIADSYACRQGKGRITALLRARRFAGRFRFFLLKMDVRRYFDSVSHDHLLERLRRRFKDGRLLLLFERIVRCFRGEQRRGLPIGSLTSQHFANFYLGWFDRFAKETLRLPGYVRYMDDMALWADDADRLKQALRSATAFLGDELDLELKPTSHLNLTSHGMDFLGCRVFPGHMVLNRRSRVRFRRKLARLEELERLGHIDEAELQHRATALVAFTRTEGVSAWSFRRAVLQSLAVSGQRARTG